MTGVGTGIFMARSGSHGIFYRGKALTLRHGRRVSLIGSFALSSLLPLAVCQAQPPQVDFEGIKIAVESKSTMGADAVAIQFGGEKFLTTEEQAGRSVALRLLRNPERASGSEGLLPSIVSAAMRAQDAQILTAVIDQGLSAVKGSPLSAEETWRQLTQAPLGQRLVTEALSREAIPYSEGVCLASLECSRHGSPARLSTDVSSKCLSGVIDRVMAEGFVGARSDISSQRIQDALSAFGNADQKALESANRFAQSLRGVQEAKTAEAYLIARDAFSRDLLERGLSQDRMVVMSSFDDAFLERAIAEAPPTQALLLVPHLSFDHRSQRTHAAVLKALQELKHDESFVLREEGVMEGVLRFVARDSEIADTFERQVNSVITTLAQRGDTQALLDVMTSIQQRGAGALQRFQPSIVGAIGFFLARGNIDGAERLRHIWGGSLPMSLRLRWWLIRTRAVLWCSVLAGIGVGALLLRRRRTGSRLDSVAPTATSQPQWPPGYEDAMRQVGLTPGLSLVEIKQAYRTAIKRDHPDLNPDASAEQQAKFREIVANFERVIELHQHIR
jgi:hypothetical protein